MRPIFSHTVDVRSVKRRRLSRTLAWLCCLGLLTACAHKGGSLPPDTLVLGKVSFILTKEQILADQCGYATVHDFYATLRAQGVTDEHIAAERVVAIQGAVYWVNTASGIRHPSLTVAVVPRGSTGVDPGSVVELRSHGPSHFLTVERVREHNAGEKRCTFVEALAPLPVQAAKDMVGILSLIGPSGQATMYCPGIEQEGWVQDNGYWIKPAKSPLGSDK